MVLVSAVFYFVIAHDLDRIDFIRLVTLFSALFFFCFKLIQFEKWNFKFLLVAGILFRLVFLVAEPNLSQDYFRFIWDGQLMLSGRNPFLYIPDDLIAQPDFLMPNAGHLHDGMGALSAKHYSNYPPLNQLIFAFATLLGGKSILGSVICMRLIIVSADIGIFFIGRKLLKHLNRSPYLILWYFLNPLVIIELTGNLHFEGVMLFFFIWSLYLLSVNQWIWAAVVYGLSISVKLVPLLFLPLFIKHFGIKKSIFFFVVLGGVILLLWIPFYTPEFIENYVSTVGLWFSNFEFNAGIYNAVKQIALHFDAKPWELIKSYGKITPYFTILVVLFFSMVRKNQKLSVLLGSMLWVLAIYYFFSPTIHPWYIIFLILLTIYTDLRFPLFWSAAIILSYSAYTDPDYTENLWLLCIEYFIVFGFMFYEIFRLKAQKSLFHKN
ncbi:MAG TPA: hypothetical protein VKN36_12660 [Eudoraea sp.]|nr:hypothetical protein [Eudoraea sp.]